MAKIHWLVYVIVGLFISIASYKLNYDKFIFFFYSGLIFVFIGVVKLIFSVIKGRMNKQEETQKAIQPKIHPQHRSQQYKRCRKCGNVVRFHDSFCAKCGARV